jgi:polysaccharide pyruvyl transferase WcaK-like protein
MFNGGYTRDNMFGLKLDYPAFLSALVSALLQHHPVELWLVPHTYGAPDSVESDPEACRRVRDALPVDLHHRVRIVIGEYDCHEIKGVIGQTQFFVGSRMHACIAALSQGIPCVGVAYSRKFAGVFESVGMQEWVIDARTTSNADAVARMLELYQQRDLVRDSLRKRAAQAREKLTTLFRRLMQTALPITP